MRSGDETSTLLVLSPDLIRRVYRLQYNVWENTILKVIRAGVGFGSGTETISSPDQIFCTRPADSLKNRVDLDMFTGKTGV